MRIRKPDFGVAPGLSKKYDSEFSLEMFRRMSKIRYFEKCVIESVQSKLIDYMVYLSSGQEAIPAALSLALAEFMIFTQHRCHGAYLAFGGNSEKLRDELLGLQSGSSCGKAGSNCLQCHTHNTNMFGHHGLIGENVPLGVGAALGSGKPTLCIFGDGAAEEDYVFAAMGFAVTHKLPVMFVCEDNNLSILTPVAVRRSWSITDVAKSLGMPAIDIADDPWSIHDKALQFKKTLPALMNIYTCRANWHVGIGVDGPPEWDRFAITREELKKAGMAEKAGKIEEEAISEMGKIWDKDQLQKPSKN